MRLKWKCGFDYFLLHLYLALLKSENNGFTDGTLYGEECTASLDTCGQPYMECNPETEECDCIEPHQYYPDYDACCKSRSVLEFWSSVRLWKPNQTAMIQT